MWNPPGCSSSSQNPANISLFDEDSRPNAPFSCSPSTPNYDPFLSELHNFDSDEPVFLDLDRQTQNSKIWSQEKAQQDKHSDLFSLDYSDVYQGDTQDANSYSVDFLNSDRQRIWSDQEHNNGIQRNLTDDYRGNGSKNFEKAQEELLWNLPDSSSSNTNVLTKMMMPPPPSQDFELVQNLNGFQSGPITIEKTIQLLDRLLPDSDLPTTKKIAEDMRKWLQTQGMGIQRFAYCILGRKNQYCGLRRVCDWSEMKTERLKDYRRMYNWLTLTRSYQNQIMDVMEENHGHLTSSNNISSQNKRKLRECFEECKYPSSQKKTEIANELGIPEYLVEYHFKHLRRGRCHDPYTSSPQSSLNRPKPLTAEEVKALLDAPISLTDRPTTEAIAQQMRSWLKYRKVSIPHFSTHILGRQRAYTGLWHPYTWETMKEEKAGDYIRMYNWLKTDENMKTEILEFTEANEGVLRKVHDKKEMMKSLIMRFEEYGEPSPQEQAELAQMYGCSETDVAQVWNNYKKFSN